MDINDTEFADHDLILVHARLWRYDLPKTKQGHGWSLPIYFDRTSNLFRVVDFPAEGRTHFFAELPGPGEHEFVVTDPIQYAKDVHLNTVQFKIQP